MNTRKAYARLATLFPPELSGTRLELMALVNSHKALKTCDEVYHAVFAEILKDFQHYTKAQFELLLDALSGSIETAEYLYKQYEKIPRLACVILQLRLRYLDSLLFLKEASEKDISKFKLRVNEAIPISRCVKSIKRDYQLLLRSCRQQTALPFFFNYHIDINQDVPPDVTKCRYLFENPSYIDEWLATDAATITDSDRAPLLKFI